MTDFPRGLSSDEARRRLVRYGANYIEDDHWRSLWETTQKIILDPMGLMLVVLAIVYGLIRDYQQAGILLLASIPVFVVDVFLELRSQKALQSLKATLNPNCHVIRDGEPTEVPISVLVPDDMLIFEEGQVLPADGLIIHATGLVVNESAVTGESVPVEKIVGDPFLSGTTVVAGHGIGQVQKTGARSQFGEIASVLKHFNKERSPFHQRMNRILKWGSAAALVIALITGAVSLHRSHDWAGSVISSMTFAMAAMPEEFPLVFTLYLSLAAWRLSKKGILIKSLPAIETISQIDVICTDKTGTLTEGVLEMASFQRLKTVSVPQFECEASLWLACEPLPTDSLEKAIRSYLEPKPDVKSRVDGWQLVLDYPFETIGKHMSHVWQHPDDGCRLVMKGAVEGVMEHCRLSDETRTAIELLVASHANEGSRLIGLAVKSGRFTGDRDSDEDGATFLGIAVFKDPIRSDVIPAIQYCNASGIAIKMVTGDHLMTAHAIAEQIGLRHDDHELVTGTMLAQMSEQDRLARYATGTLFARLLPAQKLELIQALKKQGHHVAMIGDGINDAPALKLATVGISMGKNATDVARSSAEIVAMKSQFSAIVD
ncbi:cation-transporting P-type ATPase, partial [bacterium]|nr:cation-transporting P-type ATPase [bacterium]